MDNRRICINFEWYRPFKGVYECWNRDSDHMYHPMKPDDGCLDFEKKDDRKDE